MVLKGLKEKMVPMDKKENREMLLKGLKVELRCTHTHVAGAPGGLRLPLNVEDEKMSIAFAKGFVTDIAACGAHLLRQGGGDRRGRRFPCLRSRSGHPA